MRVEEDARHLSVATSPSGDVLVGRVAQMTTCVARDNMSHALYVEETRLCAPEATSSEGGLLGRVWQIGRHFGVF